MAFLILDSVVRMAAGSISPSPDYRKTSITCKIVRSPNSCIGGEVGSTGVEIIGAERVDSGGPDCSPRDA